MSVEGPPPPDVRLGLFIYLYFCNNMDLRYNGADAKRNGR